MMNCAIKDCKEMSYLISVFPMVYSCYTHHNSVKKQTEVNYALNNDIDQIRDNVKALKLLLTESISDINFKGIIIEVCDNGNLTAINNYSTYDWSPFAQYVGNLMIMVYLLDNNTDIINLINTLVYNHWAPHNASEFALVMCVKLGKIDLANEIYDHFKPRNSTIIGLAQALCLDVFIYFKDKLRCPYSSIAVNICSLVNNVDHPEHYLERLADIFPVEEITSHNYKTVHPAQRMDDNHIEFLRNLNVPMVKCAAKFV